MIGIIFATAREAQPFLDIVMPHLMRHPDLDPSFRWDDTIVNISGMGPENAKIATEELIKTHKITEIINVGIAGALKDHFEIGHIVRVSKVVNQSSNSYNIVESDDFWANLPPAVLLTTPEPVFDNSLRVQLSKLADIVDMEGFEIARACDKNNIKFSAIKAISDFASDGHREKLFENIDKLSGMLAELLRKKILCLKKY